MKSWGYKYTPCVKPFWCNGEGSTVATVWQTAALSGSVNRFGSNTLPFSSTLWGMLWGTLQTASESRRDQEQGGELDSQEEASPEEIKRREVVLGHRERAGLLLRRLFPNGGATDIVFVTLFCIAVGTATAWCDGRCAVPDGHCLNVLLFWRRSTAALVFRVGACFEVSLFCPPFPTRPRP